MSGLSVRSVPNILSILRMALSPALLLLTDNIPLFVCAYIGIGLSDILDGFIARKFRAETNLGAKLDSIADAVFFITLLLVLSTWFTAVLMAYRGFIIAIIAVRLGNILITKIKFKKIIFIHTVANLRGNSVQGQPFFMGLQLLIIYFMSGCRFLFRGLL